jgi:hypothetical protein
MVNQDRKQAIAVALSQARRQAATKRTEVKVKIKGSPGGVRRALKSLHPSDSYSDTGNV